MRIQLKECTSDDVSKKQIKDCDGTQVTDIAKKVDYPQIKKGKSITTPQFECNKVIQEDETPKEIVERLGDEEQEAISSYDQASHNKELSKDTIKLLDHIKKEEIEHYLELRNTKEVNKT